MPVALAFLVGLGSLHGVVTRGPTTPVCQVGKPCSEPATGTVLAFSHNGRVSARVRVGVDGRYSVRLAAGYYAVRITPPQKIGGIKPAQVRVRAGLNNRLDFAIDTGIR